MRAYTHNFILTVLSMLAMLLLCPTSKLQAGTIMLTGNPSFGYEGILVGPYTATLDNNPNALVFCLDLHIETDVNRSYTGDFSTPNTGPEKEAAFLAAYSLYLGAPNESLVNKVEGPISMAIWQLMGTMGSTLLDPAAQSYVQLAQSAYSSTLIPASFLSTVTIWTPTSGVSAQRFITAVRSDNMVGSAVPECGTGTFLNIGVVLMGLSRLRRSGHPGASHAFDRGSGPANVCEHHSPTLF